MSLVSMGFHSFQTLLLCYCILDHNFDWKCAIGKTQKKQQGMCMCFGQQSWWHVTQCRAMDAEGISSGGSVSSANVDMEAAAGQGALPTA